MPTIRFNAYNPAKNLVGLPNVGRSAKFTSTIPDSQTHTNVHLYEVLHPLTVSRPNWRFLITNASAIQDSANKHILVANEFKIVEDNANLGTVRIQHSGISYKIEVSNHRITEKRQRGSAYRTEDEAKATLAIRKHFYKPTTDEMIAKKWEAAASVLSSEYADKHWRVNIEADDLFSRSTDFAQSHIEQYVAQYQHLESSHAKWLEAKNMAGVVTSVKEAFDNAQSVLIILEGEHYVVLEQGSKQAQTYTHETLPYAMRERVGLLKLVDDKQMISDVGCRIDARAFLLLPVPAQAEEKSE